MFNARARSWIGLLVVLASLGSRTPARAQSGNPLVFYAVEPCRVFDTRTGAQGGALVTVTPEPPPPAPPLGSSVARTFRVRNECLGRIPARAEVVAYNLTVLSQPYAGHVVLYPSNAITPETANLNFGASQTISNGGVVSVNVTAVPDLAVKLAAIGAPLQSHFHIVFDVTGYFAP